MRIISIHDICSTMSSDKAKWSTRPELTTTLCPLMDKPDTRSSDDIAVIESFVISLYSVSCTLTDVNKAHQQIFAQSSRTFEYLPPTKAALEEHIKRTTLQAGYVWGQSIIATQVLPSPSLWGWVQSETRWVPFWTALPRAANTKNVLISCGCNTSCTGRCSFYEKDIVCTARCRYSGHYYGRSNPPPTPPSN